LLCGTQSVDQARNQDQAESNAATMIESNSHWQRLLNTIRFSRV